MEAAMNDNVLENSISFIARFMAATLISTTTGKNITDYLPSEFLEGVVMWLMHITPKYHQLKEEDVQELVRKEVITILDNILEKIDANEPKKYH